MLDVTEEAIRRRLRFDNPWWESAELLDRVLGEKRERLYLRPFYDLVTNRQVNRAVVLMGPRRVGKTVILRQTVKRLIAEGTDAHRIFFASLENPLYTGLGLEQLLNMFLDMGGHDRFSDLYVFFDEVQYLKGWEVHLKTLVDSYPSMRFVVSGSAAAALKMKSNESGAGRFTDFLLPPLTFAEFCAFRDVPEEEEDVDRLNDELMRYIEFGGFPEAVLNVGVRDNLQQFVSSDIIDKVLLRDLPSLYGIDDPQELNRFFTMLVFNTGNEVSIDELSKKSGVAKNTIRKYLDYLEAAFLIHRLYRVDFNARHFKRITHFKVYVTNPSLHAALFGMSEEEDRIGHLMETAVVAQLLHDGEAVKEIAYARWDGGEVDVVFIDQTTQKPVSAIEIKWKNKLDRDDANNLIKFAARHGLSSTRAHIIGKVSDFSRSDIRSYVWSVSYFCLSVGNFLNETYLSKGIHPRRILPELDPPG